jgi:hypothetical protein
MTKVYRSKVDKWLLGILVGAMVVAIFGGLATVAAGVAISPWFTVFGILPVLLGVGLPLWVLTSTKYTLFDDVLIVKSALFTWVVPLNEIHRVAATSNPLSSPALSLDRLRIEYGNRKWIMISPEDKEDFVSDLRSRASFQLDL